VDRRERLLGRIDTRRQRGLEVGALHHPVTDRASGAVFYVDHADTAALRSKYADHAEVDDVVDVDVVWADRPLCAALDDAGVEVPVDYVIASHVLEHVPNPIEWLHQVAEVLDDDGVLTLALPDKRYCFDARRASTDLADWLDAYATDRRRPTIRTMVDFWSLVLPVDTPTLWADPSAYDDRPVLDGEAWARARSDAGAADYVDVHCSVFTPDSFVDLCRRLGALDLLPFRFVAFHPTAIGELEFFATLERLPSSMAADERRAAQEASLPALSTPPVAAGAPEASYLRVSPAEARVIAAKRRVMGRLRRLSGR
jgi:hypothetical protein